MTGEENILGSQSNLYMIARISVYLCVHIFFGGLGLFLFFSQQGQALSHGTMCAMLHNVDSHPRDSTGLEMMKRECQVNRHCVYIIIWL